VAILADYRGLINNTFMPGPPPSPRPLHEPQLLRFRLRQLMLFVTLASVLWALLAVTQGPWPWIIVSGALLVGAHVMGNLIGTRLRESSADVVRWRAYDPRHGPDEPIKTTEPYEVVKSKLPPETTLAAYPETGRWLKWLLLAGLLVGATMGGTILMLTIGPRIGWAGWAVGTLSAAVLGVWAAFLASCFTTIARVAWRQANEKR